jgi:hypothetical protein
MAYTKVLWKLAGGWPAWLGFSEDTLFDHKLRRMNAQWRFAGDAVVHWRPRTTLREVAKQFFNYGTGRGHTQIGAADFTYNLRSVALFGLATALCFVTPAALVLASALFFYFYVWTFHAKATRISHRACDWRAYPLTILVMWVVLASNVIGYWVGSGQRRRNRDRFRRKMDAYLGAA